MFKLAPFKCQSSHPRFVNWSIENTHFLDLFEKNFEDVEEYNPLNLLESTKLSNGSTMKEISRA